MQRNIIYLACPYTHSDPTIQRDRVELASMVAAKLMSDGAIVYSPITHGHAIAQHLAPAVSRRHDFWMEQCLPFLAMAKELIILPMPGWRLSKGVNQELVEFRKTGLPVLFVRGPKVWQLDQLTDHDLNRLGADAVIVS